MSCCVHVPRLFSTATERRLWRQTTLSHRNMSTLHTQGYQSMGSFHSEDVDTLMLQSDDEYSPPSLPFEENESTMMVRSNKHDGDFLLDRHRWTFLNHGAFGAALTVGYQRAEQWRYHLERQPLRFFDRELLPHMVHSARRMADFVDAPSRESTTLIPNVTYGLNTILRGYVRQFGSKSSHIILWDTSYGSLKKLAHQLCDQVTEIPLGSKYLNRIHEMNHPETIFELALTETLHEHRINTDNVLLVLDHTTSNTAINMPLESLSKFAKEKNMLVLVDGAHGLLAQTVNLSALSHVDFYLGNGHKWLSCPRGIGMMYCPIADLRDTILEEPAVMSHGIGQGYQSRYLWDGCRDYAAALSLPAVLDYWQEQGVTDVQNKIQSMLHAAVEVLGKAWHNGEGMDRVTLVPLEMHSPMMALVRLPNHLQISSNMASSDDSKRIQDYLFDQLIEVPIKCINGELFVRISCHVYNEVEEYERLARTLLQYRP